MESPPSTVLLTEREQIATDLQRAAELIREHGLATTCYHDRVAGTYCPIGAIHEAVAPGFWSTGPEQVYMDPERTARCRRAVTALKRFLQVVKLTPWDNSAIIRWVDEPGRTAEQVCAALDGAAAVVLA